jgi:magnesium chelatase subunit D
MIAFRDQGADLVLPPTRALARAKRSLQGLAAGGSTPLATALAKALDMTTRARAAGQTPHVVLISDGRGNRALDGAPDRARAADEAILLARQFAASAVPVTLLDTGMRPSRALNDLSEALGTKAVVLTRSPRASLADQLVSELTT